MTAYLPSAKLLEVLAYLRESEHLCESNGYTSMVGYEPSTLESRTVRSECSYHSDRAASHPRGMRP